jgi:hypothetical protein
MRPATLARAALAAGGAAAAAVDAASSSDEACPTVTQRHLIKRVQRQAEAVAKHQLRVAQLALAG